MSRAHPAIIRTPELILWEQSNLTGYSPPPNPIKFARLNHQWLNLSQEFIGVSFAMKSFLSFLCISYLAAFSFSPVTQAQDKVEMKKITAGEFIFKYTEPWVSEEPSSSMRAGQLTYEQKSEYLENVGLVIYYFGQGQGGGIEANINRWVAQFQGTPEKKIEKKKFGDREVIFLTASGTYMESMGGPFSGNKKAKPNSMMLAAILPSEKGAVFLKVTGPKKSVEAMRKAFDEFVASPFSD